MDCNAARKFLDVFESSAESQDSGIPAEAVDHLRQCRECQAILNSRNRFDRRIAHVCRDVPVPEAARQDLLELLEARQGMELAPSARLTDPVANTIAAPASTNVPVTRRRLMRRVAWSVVSAACVVGIAITASWWLTPKFPMISLEEVAQAATAPESLATLPLFSEFGDGTPFRTPSTVDLTPAFDELQLRALSVGETQVAACAGTLIASRKRKVEVRLIAVPRRWLSSAPTATRFLQGPPVYVGRCCTTAWVEGDFAYVVVVSGGENELHRLLPRHSSS